MKEFTQYRYTIDKKTKELFLESFKKALNKVNKKKFGFIGIVGSITEEESHDIDIIIFPNLGTKIGDAIIEYAKLYDETEKQIKRKNKRYYIVASQKFATQETTNHLSAIEEGQFGMIPLHSMFFTNYRDFKRFSPKKFIKEVEENSLVLYGSLEKARKLPTLPQKKLEPYFFILDFEMNSRIKTFPRHLIRTSAEALFEYLEKKYGIEVKDKIPHNPKEIEKEFIKLIRRLDKLTYS